MVEMGERKNDKHKLLADARDFASEIDSNEGIASEILDHKWSNKLRRHNHILAIRFALLHDAIYV